MAAIDSADDKSRLLARTRPGLIAGAVFSEPPIFSLAPVAGQAFMTEVAAVVRPAADTGGRPAAVDAFFRAVCPGLWSRLDETARTTTGLTGR